MLSKTAKVISAFSHPVVLFPLSVPFFMTRTEVSPEKLLLFLPILFILSLPILYFLYSLKAKKISDWDVSERHERYPFYFLSLACGGVALVFLWFFAQPDLFTFGLILYFLGILVTLINFFWKISVHAAGVTAGVFAFNHLFAEPNWLYLLIPLVVWSRFEEKKHTLAQILAGVLLGAVVVMAVLTLRTGVSS